MRTICLLTVLALVAGAVSAQELQWTQRVDDASPHHRAEVALGVSKDSKDVIVAWMHYHAIQTNPTPPCYPIVHVHYNVAVDGEAFRTDPGRVPITSETITGGDPMVTFSTDGQGIGWVGYLGTHCTQGNRHFWIARKDPGDPYSDVAVDAHFPTLAVDKGVLVAGPPPGPNSDADLLGLTFARLHSSTYRTQSIISQQFGALWDEEDIIPIGEDHPDGNEGGPNGAVIIRNTADPASVGRWVVAHHHALPEHPPAWNCHSQSGKPLRPRAVWSPDGLSWFNSTEPMKATIPGTDPLSPQTPPEEIVWFSPNCPDDLNPAGGPFVLNTPSLAADPREERTMYMVFMGRTESQGLNNVELFIARSMDGGINFSHLPDQPPGSQVLHLRRSDLCIDNDPDKCDPLGSVYFLPSITVDWWGGINLVYYVGWRENNVWRYRVKYARIPEFRTYPVPVVFNSVLTPGEGNYFDLVNAPVVAQRVGRTFFGDYMMADSRVCEIYAGYVSRHEEEHVGVYVSKIDLCLDADIDRDLQLTSNDIDLFVTLFAAEDPRADLNDDGLFTIDDVNRFWASYNCRCSP